MENRPFILITNDDGIHAKGLKELTEVMRSFGDVVVIAPEMPMSGMSGAISVDKPMRITKLKEEQEYTVYKCQGTPVDCVKVAFNQLLHRTPDFVVSGINHGANSSISVVYSGTIGAAIEGSLHGVTSIGFSLCDYGQDIDFTEAKTWVAKIFRTVAAKGLPPFTCLNVNIPKGEIRGVEVCRQTAGKWIEEIEKRTDPQRRDYFWLSGVFKNLEPDTPGTDIYALEHNMVAVVPVKADMTCAGTFEAMKDWQF